MAEILTRSVDGTRRDSTTSSSYQQSSKIGNQTESGNSTQQTSNLKSGSTIQTSFRDVAGIVQFKVRVRGGI